MTIPLRTSGRQLQPLVRRRPLQESPEFLHRKAGIANDATHRLGIHGIVSRDGENADTVAHDDVLALSNDPETSLFQRPYRVLMVDAGDLRHV